MSVSYTHLDVYKRQILYPAFLNLWAIFSVWLLMYVSVMNLLFPVFVCCLFCVGVY